MDNDRNDRDNNKHNDNDDDNGETESEGRQDVKVLMLTTSFTSILVGGKKQELAIPKRSSE